MENKDLEKMFNIRLPKRCCENCYFNQESICKFNNELIKESKECDYFIDKKMVLEQMINNAMEIKKIKNMIENPDFQKKMDVFIEKNQELKEQKSLEEHAKKLEENFKELFDGVNIFGKAKEEIESANPSEALECVDVLKEDGIITTLYQGKALETIRQALLKAQEQEKENAEYKIVLKIIFEKNVDIVYLKDSNNIEEYNNHFGCVICKLTEEEFNLLKRYCDKKGE